MPVRALALVSATAEPEDNDVVVGLVARHQKRVGLARGFAAGRRRTSIRRSARSRGPAAGESFCSPRVTALLLRRLAVLAAGGRSDGKVLALTQREMQIVHLLELGLSNKEIDAQANPLGKV
jgi:hypothetical protein